MATIQRPSDILLDSLAVRAARTCIDAGLLGVEARVVAAFDVSGTMAGLHRSGRLLELGTAVLALAMRFDDDGIVPVWSFSERAAFVGELRDRDHVGFMTRHFDPAGQAADTPRASLAPVIDGIGRQLFGRRWAPSAQPDMPAPEEARDPCPAFVILFTGGDCDDPQETEAMLRYASRFPVFWQFAAVGGAIDDFAFLRRIDVLEGTHVDSQEPRRNALLGINGYEPFLGAP